jgi:hypothetical protein
MDLLVPAKYRADIVGMRAIAVLGVVAFHAFPGRMPGGFIGVDVFFVLSGYLISLIIIENLASQSFSFRDFYSRRIIRIFPALITTLVGTLILSWLVMIADELNDLGFQIIAGMGFFSNFVLWGQTGYFDSSAEYKPLLHLWSLAVEEQYYIFWPLMLWFFWKRRSNVLTLISILLIGSFLFNVKFYESDKIGAFYLPYGRIWEFLCGATLAYFVIEEQDSLKNIKMKFGNLLSRIIGLKRSESNEHVFSSFLSVIGISLLAFGFFRLDKTMIYPGFWTIIPVLGTVLLIMAGPNGWVNQNILSQPVLIWFGLISYSLYLWHWPLISFMWIVESGTPSTLARFTSVVISIVLAWLTTRFIERPFRFGKGRIYIKATYLCVASLILVTTSLLINQSDLSKSRGFQDLAIKRNGFEHALGTSLDWYEGKNNWLFLGNNYSDSVAKLKLDIEPTTSEINFVVETFAKAASAASLHGTQMSLIIGPSKENVYQEYLPDDLEPSIKKYSSFFLSGLSQIPNLNLYNPTNELISSKKSQGILYWKSDTHWNAKGAYIAYQGFANSLGLPVPNIEFTQGTQHRGDLIDIAKLKNFPLDPEDNWDIAWKRKPAWSKTLYKSQKSDPFGPIERVINNESPSDEYVWVIGDSFSEAMRDYFNSTFREVFYVGHWSDKLPILSSLISDSQKKPDHVVVIRAERTF